MRVTLSFLILLLLPLSVQADWKERYKREFADRPWIEGEVQQNVCIDCHSSEMMKPELRNIPEEWKRSWHAENEISCQSCHGGDSSDAADSMSPQKGFVGTPKPNQVPEFCGKCHVGIFKNFMESGHGKALKATGKGPDCVTCHGAHNVQKASIQIINERLCTKCHSYERVKLMKQALLVTENRMNEIERGLKEIKTEGVFTGEEEKSFFSTQASFRTLFHTEDVSLVKKKTDEFLQKLNQIQIRTQKTMEELQFRRNYSAFLMVIFIGLAVGFFWLTRLSK